MKQNKLTVLLITTLIFIIAILVFLFTKPKTNAKECVVTNSANINIDYYIYIDTSNNLLLLDKFTKEEILISKNVLDFKIGDKAVIYSYKNNTGTNLVVYSLSTQQYNTIHNHYINDYIVYNNFMYTVENFKIIQTDLTTFESKELFPVKTEDLIFNYVDDKQLIFSSIINSVPTSQQYIFAKNFTSLIAFNSTNIMVHGNYIYGLNEDSNLFRIDVDGNTEIISDFVILKFYIDDNFLIYIDAKGKLNTLEYTSTNRVVADYASNFLVKNNSLYYISRHSNNKLYKTSLTGGHKEVILEKVNSDFKFNEF